MLLFGLPNYRMIHVSKGTLIMSTTKILIFLLSLSFSSLLQAAEPSQIEKNKALVVKFYEIASVEHKDVEAAELYVSEDYIQHDPWTATGRQAFIDYLVSSEKEKPDAFSTIKRVIAEGDLVVLHVHDRINKEDRGA
jgi:predicted SnoaL-like aldol condensation-catalyzing enzyme